MTDIQRYTGVQNVQQGPNYRHEQKFGKQMFKDADALAH